MKTDVILRSVATKDRSLRFFAMLRITVLAAVFLFAANKISFAETSVFAEANAKYQSRDYKAATELYHKIIESGKSSSAVFYNLGNAQYRFGQKGQALISYERAARLSPRDEDIRWNIDVLKSLFLDRIDFSDDPIVIYWIKKATGFFSINEMALVFSGVIFLWMAAAFLFFFFPGFPIISP